MTLWWLNALAAGLGLALLAGPWWRLDWEMRAASLLLAIAVVVFLASVGWETGRRGFWVGSLLVAGWLRLLLWIGIRLARRFWRRSHPNGHTRGLW